MSREIYKRIAPHLDRVRYDGGTEPRRIDALIALARYYEERKDSIKLLYCPALTGNKFRTSGANTYVTKGYDLSPNRNDLAQATALNQPDWCGNIAPTEMPGIKNPNGGSKFLTHSNINFAANEAWSVTTVLDFNGKGIHHKYYAGTIGATLGGISLGGNGGKKLHFSNTVKSLLGISTIPFVGKKIIVTYSADGLGSLKMYVNGFNTNSFTGETTSILFQQLGDIITGDYGYKGQIKAHAICSQAPSSQDVANEHALLRAVFPEIESVKIGTQTWATSNCEMAATPMGTVIPEVQSNATWATSQTLYTNKYNERIGLGDTVEQATYAAVKAAAMWCHYNNDIALGSIYGKLYNWFAVKLLQMDIDYYNANNPTAPWGWRVPTQADFQALSTFLGGDAVSGDKLKIAGTTYWNSPNTGADNSSGFSALGCGYVSKDNGISFDLKNQFILWCINGSSTSRVVLNKDNSVLSIVEDSTKAGFSLRLIKS